MAGDKLNDKISREELLDIVEKNFIEYIVDKVIEKIYEQNKKALVIFTGAAIGFTQAIKSLRSLKCDGWQFECVLSESAENVFGEGLIQDLLNPKKIFTEKNVKSISELVNNNNYVIIPCLTINTTSKLANCIYDNLATNIVMSAMSFDKPVIVSINGCCPDNEERNQMGFNVSEKLKEKLRDNISTLKSFDINITIAENLEKKVTKIFYKKNNIKTVNSIESNKISSNYKHEKIKLNIENNSLDLLEEKKIKIEDKIISRSVILENKDFNIIEINKNSIVTDLAKEEIYKFNIELKKV